MVKRKRAGALTVSLFPFLSILACVIGTLTLMICALAIGQMTSPDLELAHQLYDVERRQSDVRKSISELQRDVAQHQANASVAAKQLVPVRNEVDQLNKKLELLRSQKTPDVEPPSTEPFTHQAKTLEDRIRELEKDLAARRDEVKKLRDEIARRQNPPEEAVVKIRPSGTGVDIRPIFVECTNTSIVIHEKEKPVRVRSADLASSAAFLELARRVAKQPDSRIIFLIRDNGLATYDRARRVATDNYARNGKLPVIGQGELDLSLFW